MSGDCIYTKKKPLKIKEPLSKLHHPKNLPFTHTNLHTTFNPQPSTKKGRGVRLFWIRKIPFPYPQPTTHNLQQKRGPGWGFLWISICEKMKINKLVIPYKNVYENNPINFFSEIFKSFKHIPKLVSKQPKSC